ncbi:MAG TPA: AMP-binding protein [Acidimicrobiales bacterium]|nr:AMP-binding protein [Acidimicrobiales bacterium]
MTTLAYTAGPVDDSIMNVTVGAALRQAAAKWGDAEALVSRHQNIRLSWNDLDAAADEAARGLLALGVGRGDRIGIWSPTCAEWTILQFASARVGSILVNVNPAYRPSELLYALNKVGVRMVVTARQFKTSDYHAMVKEVRGDVPSLERVVALGVEKTDGPDDLLWSDLLALGATVPADALAQREAQLDTYDPINIQFTSGTTGNPKGATLTHHNVVNNGAAIAGVLGYTTADRVCIPVPLYHCFGMGIGNLGCVTTGATMVYPGESFEPVATLNTIVDEGITSIYGVPTMFISMLEAPEFALLDTKTLRTGIMAGAPCPVELMKRVVDEMHASEMTIAYGMTETSPVSTATRRSDGLDVRCTTVGTALPNVELKVVSPDTGETVAVGEKGELCSKGYIVMPGYWEDDAATRAAIDADGWMHTGDLAVMDDNGYCNIVGRAKDMLIRGGENIYPREIEEVLFQHPAVAGVQVFGVPDAKMGEEVAAWISLREGAAEPSEDELRTFCRERLAHFKVPRYWKFVADFPMTVTGKVQKFKMREAAVEDWNLQDATNIVTA